MLIAVIFTAIAAIGWVILDSKKTKEVVKISFFVSLFIIWGAYLFMKLDSWTPIENRYIYLILIPIFALILFKVHKSGERTNINILAKQQSYWDISPKNIYTYYRNRAAKKSDRIEISVDAASKNFINNGPNPTFLSGNIITNAKSFELTKISDISEIKNFQLYHMVFKKIENILNYFEKNIDFNGVLRENDMCVEYFLLDLWEKFTKTFNLGTANLEIYAQNDIQKEFVGALDNICLNSIKRNGATLLYLFLQFKNRLPNSGDKKYSGEKV